MNYDALATEAMDEHREKMISSLRSLVWIDIHYLKMLDRLGRVAVADTLWDRLTEGARAALLHDIHPHVRSVARTSLEREVKLTGREVCQLMRRHGVTIRGLASRMRITMKRVRAVREAGVAGQLLRDEWFDAITGTGMFAPESRE